MRDFLEQELAAGDYVAGLYSANETPALFRVVGFTPKKVKLTLIEDANAIRSKFGRDLIKLDPLVIDELLYQPPKDALGQDLKVGDYAYGSAGEYIDPVIFKIIGFLPTKALVKRVHGETHYIHGNTRHTKDLIKVDGILLTMQKLKRQSDE